VVHLRLLRPIASSPRRVAHDDGGFARISATIAGSPRAVRILLLAEMPSASSGLQRRDVSSDVSLAVTLRRLTSARLERVLISSVSRGSANIASSSFFIVALLSFRRNSSMPEWLFLRGECSSRFILRGTEKAVFSACFGLQTL